MYMLINILGFISRDPQIKRVFAKHLRGSTTLSKPNFKHIVLMKPVLTSDLFDAELTAPMASLANRVF